MLFHTNNWAIKTRENTLEKFIDFYTYFCLGIINVIEEESPPPPPKVIDKDPYNMSNDEFYTPKTHESQIKVTSGEVLQHATPVVELRAPFVPTYIGEAKLRLFHRLVMFLFLFFEN